jgi:hypothetical protein
MARNHSNDTAFQRGRRLAQWWQKQKWERHLASPIFVLEEYLESDAQAHLNPSRTLNAIRGNKLRVDHAEGGWVGRVKRRIQEIDVIEEIEEVGGKLDFQPLCNTGRFPYGHVEVPVTKTRQRTISAVISVSG